MALIDAFRSPRPSRNSRDRDPVRDAIEEITPHLYRIDLLEPRPELTQKCTYVNVPAEGTVGKQLLLRVFHEGLRVISIEVLVPEEEALLASSTTGLAIH